jgi:hypothetical protein
MPCRDDGVVCNNALCEEDDNYMCDDCIEYADKSAEGVDKDDEGRLSIHSLTDEEYAEFEGMGLPLL